MTRALKTNAILADCRELAKKSGDDRATLQREFRDLLVTRDVAFMREGRESRNAISDWDRPLGIETMREIRAEIDLPEYDAPPATRLAQVRAENHDGDAPVKSVSETRSSISGRAPAATAGGWRIGYFRAVKPTCSLM